MKSAIDKATMQGNVFCTSKLVATQIGVSKNKNIKRAPAIIGAMFFVVSILLSIFWPIALALGVCAYVAARVTVAAMIKRRFSFAQVVEAVDQYSKAHSLSKVLTCAGHIDAMSNPFEDVKRVEGVIVVSRDILVDLFVLNHLHTKVNILIVSESGYPKCVHPQVDTFLTDNPNAKIGVLHDVEKTPEKMLLRIVEREEFRKRSIVVSGTTGTRLDGVQIEFADQLEWDELSMRVAGSFEEPCDAFARLIHVSVD